MNKQEKYKNGNLIGRGIQWCNYTWNPIGGCKHRCRWTMPDGSTAICYAEEVANNVARRAYPHGFEHNYWHPARLNEPLNLKEPAKIFLDSMSDLMGHWVSDDQIKAVLDICNEAYWHTFQLLTKNAPRLLKFDYPENVWVGASTPPDFMWGKQLKHNQQVKMLSKTLDILSQIEAPITWMSVEPLSWNVAPIFKQYSVLQWVVIGAATNEKKVYQPEPENVWDLLGVLDEHKVPVFFKGNLMGNPAADPWREYFPGFERSEYFTPALAMSPQLSFYETIVI